MDGAIIALIVSMGLGWPVWLTMVIVRHREKMRMLELKQHDSPGLVEEVQALRREMAQLRETTTRFDMSFDATLDRLERRMDNLDHRTTLAEAEETFPTAAYGAAEPAKMPLRRS
ncbi:MAG: hypothetical protein V4671_26770 [Armatimonadota bacterium]